uniref:Alpha-1,3-glucosyltransferase n=1 Tax=Spongospora subterranea TaxID=70186 RepID=A0A0H5RAA4_9EUKA|eukprot:CRZ10602.1 hypothetical protein [Spongospora subterranea]
MMITMKACGGVAGLTFAALALRHAISLHSYSGANTPPMYGDYEAQRHWMEVAVNLPLQDWYMNTTDNDLQYWGLDYPPLTAYHSWIMGQIAKSCVPELVQLHRSRGIETPQTKLFMRNTVIAGDILIFFPAVFILMPLLYNRRSPYDHMAAAAFVLNLPALLLIDHGHFQYNSISLGLLLWAVIFLLRKNILLSSIVFTASFCYKQMNLYFAPAFFFIMFAQALRCGTWSLCSQDVARKGLVVMTTVAACFSPFFFVDNPSASVFQIIHRVFPVARGLYEDKVANFWCTSSLFYKWSTYHERAQLISLCMFTTLLSLAPLAYSTLRRRNISHITVVYILASSSLSFFLFSFHVHEKTILLPLMACCLLCLEEPTFVRWFSHMATFSMYPLLKKDGLQIPYFMCQLIGYAIGMYLPAKQSSKKCGRITTWFDISSRISLLGCVGIHIIIPLLPVIPRYPDIVDTGIAVYSALHFILFFLYVTGKCLFISDDFVHLKSE